MTTKARPPRWKGDEVEDAPSGEAEDAADRAEGNSPVRADAESQRLHEDRLDDEPEDDTRRVPSTDEPDEKIAEAAEEHRAREADGRRPPHGKL